MIIIDIIIIIIIICIYIIISLSPPARCSPPLRERGILSNRFPLRHSLPAFLPGVWVSCISEDPHTSTQESTHACARAACVCVCARACAHRNTRMHAGVKITRQPRACARHCALLIGQCSPVGIRGTRKDPTPLPWDVPSYGSRRVGQTTSRPLKGKGGIKAASDIGLGLFVLRSAASDRSPTRVPTGERCEQTWHDNCKLYCTILIRCCTILL